jgi:hypothetical protein
VAREGLSVTVHADDGSWLATLASFPSFTFPSFLILDPSESFALIGESTNGTIQRVDLAGAGAALECVLVLNYDAAFQDATHVLVSAATCGFGCGNELWSLDLPTHATALEAQLAGASGPLAFEPDGDLVYATVSATFPPPSGATSILRFSAAQLAAGAILSENDAAVVASGFDGASDLVADPLTSTLYVAENGFGTGINRVRRVGGSAATSPILVEGEAFRWISGLEFVAGDGVAAFAAFQPEQGGLLRYATTDFATTWERFALAPRRPTLAINGPGTQGSGLFDVDLVHGASAGLAYLFYGPSSLVPAAEYSIHLAALEGPLLLGLDPATLGWSVSPIALDPQGFGTATFTNPGGLEGSLAAQELVFNSSLKIVGTSTVAFL